MKPLKGRTVALEHVAAGDLVPTTQLFAPALAFRFRSQLRAINALADSVPAGTVLPVLVLDLSPKEVALLQSEGSAAPAADPVGDVPDNPRRLLAEIDLTLARLRKLIEAAHEKLALPPPVWDD